MALGRLQEHGAKHFKSNPNIPGGSEKGKPQGEWPWRMKIIAYYIVVSDKGSEEAWYEDRTQMPIAEFKKRMDYTAPGWEEWHKIHRGYRKTPRVKLLYNRPYKMVYSGTSDRGFGHNPETRANQSKEHWKRHFDRKDPEWQMFEDLMSGKIKRVKIWIKFKGACEL